MVTRKVIELHPYEQAGQWQRCAWFLLQLVFHRRSGGDAPGLMMTVVNSASRSKFREGSEDVAMQSYAEFLEQKGQARGEAIGEARGEVLGERKLLLRQASSRFGVPYAETLAVVEAIESQSVPERLGLRLFQVETWQELLSEL